MRNAPCWAALALAAAFALLPARSGAQTSVRSDIVDLLAGNDTLIARLFTGEPDGAATRFTLVNPILVDFLQGPNDASDELAINTLSFVVNSDTGVGARDPGEDFIPLAVQTLNDPLPNGVTEETDLLRFQSLGFNIPATVIGQSSGTPTGGYTEATNFTLLTPILVTVTEGGVFSDSILIDSFSGSYMSDGEVAVAPTPGAFQINENQFRQWQNGFQIRFRSDVPEPSALMAVPIGLLSVGWAAMRRRRTRR